MSKEKSISLDEPKSGGGYVVREVIRFAFFVRKPHVQLAPQGVSAMEQIIDLFPPPALSMFAGVTGDWFEYDAAGLKKQVAKRLVGKDQTINGNASVTGNQANIADVRADYAGFALDRPLFRERASYVLFHVAASLFEDPIRTKALQLARKLFAELDCYSGYIDLALMGKQDRKQALARRFRGIDISEVGPVSADLGDLLPGVHWINFLSADLAKKLGGRASIESGLSKNAHVDDLPGGGLVVATGANPDRGDVNKRAGLPDHEYLANLAHRQQLLHNPKKVNYFVAEEDATAVEAQERWHLRFIET